jgi:hypothetical protein
VNKRVGDNEQKTAEMPMDKGIERKNAIVDNFFENEQKRVFLRVKMNENKRFRRQKTDTGTPTMEEKKKNSTSGLAQVGVKSVVESVSVIPPPTCAKPPRPLICYLPHNFFLSFKVFVYIITSIGFREENIFVISVSSFIKIKYFPLIIVMV